MSRFRNKLGIGILLAGLSLAGAGCRYDMQDQPKMKPYRGTTFFGDGLAMRQPVPGTIPRGYLRTDKALFTGKSDTNTQRTGQAGGSAPAAGNANANAYAGDVDTFPFPITEEIVQRGRQRYDIFCSVCHGLTGHGDGMIVRRGYRQAANFHEDRLRQAPVGHFFDVVTNGWGAMPSYAPQIPVQDRWAIISYIRALQTAEPKEPFNAPIPTGSPNASQSTPASGGHQ